MWNWIKAMWNALWTPAAEVARDGEAELWAADESPVADL